MDRVINWFRNNSAVILVIQLVILASVTVVIGAVQIYRQLHMTTTKLDTQVVAKDELLTQSAECLGGGCTAKATATTAASYAATETTTSPTIAPAPAAVSNPDDAAIACFREVRARPSRGLPMATRSDAIGWCCGAPGTANYNRCASLADTP